MNYTELSTILQEFLETNEATFVSQIPTFVEAAEEKIYRSAKLPSARIRSTGTTLTVGDDTYDLPSGFLSPINMQILVSGSVVNLTIRDSSFIKEAYPSSTETGVPTCYAVLDEDEFLIGPTPDSNYAVTLDYMGFPASIVTAGTSWLGDNAPSALKWGAICEGYAFLKGEIDLYQVYKSNFAEEIALLSMEDAATRGDRFTDSTDAG